MYSISTFKFIITYRSQDEESVHISDTNKSSSPSGSRIPDYITFVIAVIIFNSYLTFLNITISFIYQYSNILLMVTGIIMIYMQYLF